LAHINHTTIDEKENVLQSETVARKVKKLSP